MIGLLRKFLKQPLPIDATKYLDGTGNFSTPAGGAVTTQTKTIVCQVDGGGSVISTGIKSDIRIPYGATITKVTLLANTTGNIVFDVWSTVYANYPPTVSNSITGTTAKPTITAAVKTESSTLTGWVTTITSGDCIRFNVDTCTTITRCAMVMEVNI